ncbi:hypothetical protein SPHINGOT1_80187 [Sphingomonas sp. T1]|nr:hypothetical protein SPHINGOT1_80187 [Sphingomonas sp. T1]
MCVDRKAGGEHGIVVVVYHTKPSPLKTGRHEGLSQYVVEHRDFGGLLGFSYRAAPGRRAGLIFADPRLLNVGL